GNRECRNDAAHLLHETPAETLDLGKTLVAGKRTEIEGPVTNVFPQGHWLAEADAGIAEAIPASAQSQPQAAREKVHQHQRVEGKARSLTLRCRGSGNLHAILEYTIVIE